MTLGTLLALIPLSGAAAADCRRREIPPRSVFLIISCAVLDMTLGMRPILPAGLNALIIGAFLLCAAVKYGGIGGGDVKLCAALAMLANLSEILWVISSALLLMIVVGKISRQKRMPFAPFLEGAFFLYQLVLFSLRR